jgi:hypothetical protein
MTRRALVESKARTTSAEKWREVCQLDMPISNCVVMVRLAVRVLMDDYCDADDDEINFAVRHLQEMIEDLERRFNGAVEGRYVSGAS